MRTLDPATAAALASRRLIARDFLWISGLSYETTLVESVGFWTGVGNAIVTVIDGQTGVEVDREYLGAGAVLGIDDIQLTSDITVRTVNVDLSQIGQAVVDAVRGYDLRQGAAEIHRGLFDPDTRALVAPPMPRFVGFVDKSVLTDPTENADGVIKLTLTSHTQELTRGNADKCSDDSQRRRNADDGFYSDVATVGEWPMFWGQEGGKVDTTANLGNGIANAVRAAKG